MRELTKRWLTDEGKQLRSNVIDCIRQKRSFESVGNLEKIDGRYDFRGIAFNESPEMLKVKSYEVAAKPLIFGGLDLSRIDFSYADFRGTYWTKCNVTNSIFLKANFKNVEINASNFLNITFDKCNFGYGYLNTRSGSESGTFIKVTFRECDLSKTIFHFPVVQNCIFENCKLYETNFDVSQFYDTKFVGLLDSVFFRGRIEASPDFFSKLFRPKRLDKIVNPMENVDFSEAELRGVSFSDGIDLGKCVFPDNGQYLFVENLQETYSKAKEIINESWEGEDKRVGLGFIDNVFYGRRNQNQPNDLIDMYILSDNGKNMDFGKKFYNLISDTMKSSRTS